jgi:hypothetical protein
LGDGFLSGFFPITFGFSEWHNELFCGSNIIKRFGLW